MHVLVDANIVLDALCDRTPFADSAKALWGKVEAKRVRAGLVATTITTIFYLVRKQLGRDEAFRAVAILVRDFEILAVDRTVLQAALARPWPDFEDAVQDAAAEMAGIPVVVTRDPRGFAGSSRSVLDAATLVVELEDAGPAPRG